MKKSCTTILIASLFLSINSNVLSVAAQEEIIDGSGTVEILQHGPATEALGNWSLILPDNSKVVREKTETFQEEMHSGKYTLLIEKAKGTSILLKYFKNGKLIETETSPQLSFTVSKDDIIKIDATYQYTLIGSVGVNSEPSGIPFILEDPNGAKFSGETPASYYNVPIGMYSVQYIPQKPCTQPAKKSDQLVENGRISFFVSLSCESLSSGEEYNKKLTHVTIQNNGKTVVLEDVPLESWFANFVHKVAKTGIMSGYRAPDGAFTGKFGPSDSVSIAQLVKVAHEVAGIDETKVRGVPSNIQARGTWFEEYYVSAEEKHWLVFRDDNLDPARDATRGEVIATLLQALNVSRVWPRGDIFRDVTPETHFSASIETAAIDGIINADSGGFRPNDSINRAELAKILSRSIDMYIEDSPEFTGASR